MVELHCKDSHSTKKEKKLRKPKATLITMVIAWEGTCWPTLAAVPRMGTPSISGKVHGVWTWNWLHHRL